MRCFASDGTLQYEKPTDSHGIYTRMFESLRGTSAALATVPTMCSTTTTRNYTINTHMVVTRCGRVIAQKFQELVAYD